MGAKAQVSVLGPLTLTLQNLKLLGGNFPNSLSCRYEAWVIYNFLSLCLAWVGGPGVVATSLHGRFLKPSWHLMTCCCDAIPLDGYVLSLFCYHTVIQDYTHKDSRLEMATNMYLQVTVCFFLFYADDDHFKLNHHWMSFLKFRSGHTPKTRRHKSFIYPLVTISKWLASSHVRIAAVQVDYAQQICTCSLLWISFVVVVVVVRSVASFWSLPTPQRIMTIGSSRESPNPPSNCESLTNLWTWQSSIQGTYNRYFLQPHVDIESTKKYLIPCRRILPCIVVGGGWSQRPHDILQPRLVVLFLSSDKHGPSLLAQSRFKLSF